MIALPHAVGALRRDVIAFPRAVIAFPGGACGLVARSPGRVLIGIAGPNMRSARFF
jgi:hypothetical protein